MMNDNDVLGLLIYANELDGRHAPNEAKVYAWKEVFDASAPSMDAQFAKEVIRKHYGIHETMVSPAKIVQAWNAKRRAASEARMAYSDDAHERHCGFGGCRCTHADPCFKGWFDEDTYASPCPMCRPGLTEALVRIAPLGQRSEHDHAAIRMREWGGPDAT